MKIFNDLSKLLLYGSLSKEDYNHIVEDIRHSNQKSVTTFSLVGAIAFCLALFLSIFNEPMKSNRLIYFIAALVLILLMFICKALNNNRGVVNFCLYFFMIIMYAAGIYLGAVTGIKEQTSTFMVLLFAVPLLFITRPIYSNLLIIFADVMYMIMLHVMGQEAELLSKNMVNAIIYGFVSVVVSSAMMRIKLERIYVEQRNRYLSETDQLSGLMNRRAFDSACRELVSNKKVGIIFTDLNSLKYTNDNFGHEAGDKLIVDYSKRLSKNFDKANIFRISGDEFVIILSSINPEEFESKVESFFNMINDDEYPIAAIGGAYGNGEKVIEILAAAEKKMYADKEIFHKKYPKYSRKNA